MRAIIRLLFTCFLCATTASAAPPDAAVAFVNEHKLVLDSLPDHPLAHATLAGLLRVYGATEKADPLPTLRRVIEDFANLDLGLYALDEWLSPQTTNAQLTELLARVPDSRVGARLVDLLAARDASLVKPQAMLAQYPATRAAAQAVLVAAEAHVDSGQHEDALRLLLGAVDAVPPSGAFPFKKWSALLASLPARCGVPVLDTYAHDFAAMSPDEARVAAAALKEMLAPLLGPGDLWALRADRGAMAAAMQGPQDSGSLFAALQVLAQGITDEQAVPVERAARFIEAYCLRDGADPARAAEIASAVRAYLHNAFDQLPGGAFSRALRAQSDRLSACAMACSKKFAAQNPTAPALHSFLTRNADRYAKEFRFLPENNCLRLLLAGWPQDPDAAKWLTHLAAMESKVWRNHAEAAALERRLWTEYLAPEDKPAAILQEIEYLYQGEKFREARALTQRLVPGMSEAVRDPARVYETLIELRTGDLERAKVLADNFLSARAGSVWRNHVLLLRAYTLMILGRYPMALKDCEELEGAGLDPERARKVREMLADLAAAMEKKLGAAGDPAAPPARPGTLPNIVLISLDTTRADRLGCYGNAAARTPNIDQLAAEGVLFERAYSTSSWTKPAHASVMTGRYPLAHGAQGHDDAIAPKAGMLAEWLKTAGYATGATISAPPLNSVFGFGRGFDAYDDYTYEFDRVCNLFLRGNDGKVKIHLGATSPLITFSAMMQFGRTLPRDAPIFYFVNYFDPHHNYQPVAPWNAATRAKYSGNDWGMIDQWNTPEAGDLSAAKIDTDRLRALYDDEIAAVDYEVGDWRHWANATGAKDNTIFVIFGDHGEEFLEHGKLAHGHGLYDEVLHVPLILCGPGIPKGTRITTPVSLVDIAPTLLALSGLPAQDGLDGQSLVPLMKGEPAAPRPLYAGLNLLDFEGYAVIDGNDKLIANTRDGHYTLTNLATDPGEAKDLAPQQAARLRELVELGARMQDAQRQTGLSLDAGAVVTGDAVPSLDALMEQFRAMGYIGK